ncbi:hypothetical protein FRC01_014246, partial [Tulasnella sp. 417]
WVGDTADEAAKEREKLVAEKEKEKEGIAEQATNGRSPVRRRAPTLPSVTTAPPAPAPVLAPLVLGTNGNHRRAATSSSNTRRSSASSSTPRPSVFDTPPSRRAESQSSSSSTHSHHSKDNGNNGRRAVAAAVVEVGRGPRESEDIEHHGTVEEAKVLRDPSTELMASMGSIDERAMGEGPIEGQEELGEDIPLLAEQHIASVLKMECLRESRHHKDPPPTPFHSFNHLPDFQFPMSQAPPEYQGRQPTNIRDEIEATQPLLGQSSRAGGGVYDQPGFGELPDDFKYGVSVYESAPEIRQAFVRKVYSILFAQLLATTVVSGYMQYVNASVWIQNNIWAFYTAMIGSFVTLGL